MDSTRIYRLEHLPAKLRRRLGEAQIEAARVWTLCRDLHLQARQEHLPWPNRDDLQTATKGRFALHSQTVQMICHKFLTNVENTQQVRKRNPRIRYPFKDKRFHALYWSAQAVSIERGRVVLPMGRGRGMNSRARSQEPELRSRPDTGHGALQLRGCLRVVPASPQVNHSAEPGSRKGQATPRKSSGNSSRTGVRVSCLVSRVLSSIRE